MLGALLTLLAVQVVTPAAPSAPTAPSPVAQSDPVPSSADRQRIFELASLVLGAPTDEGRARIREALVHPHPSVRSAAARVAHVVSGTALLAELRGALKVERHRQPQLEMVSALADLDPSPEADEVLEETLTREENAPDLVDALIAGRAPRLVRGWGRFRAAVEAEPSGVSRGLELGLYEELATPLATFALRDGLPRVYSALVTRRPMRIDRGVLVAGLQALDPTAREAAYLSLALRGEVLTPEDLARRISPTTLRERTLRHLFEAATQAPTTETLEALAQALPEDAAAVRLLSDDVLSHPSILRGVSAAGRRSLLVVLKTPKDRIEDLVAARFAETPASPGSVRAIPVRTVGALPDDYVASVLSGAGCRGAEGSFDGAEVTFGPGGRVRRLASIPSSSSAPNCAGAVRILAASMLSRDGEATSLVLLPERPTFLACQSDPVRTWARAGDRRTRVGGNIKEPTKIRSVNPTYPAVARDKLDQGIVILEALVSRSGCVAELRVLRSVSASLDLSAVDAVSGWGYTPTLLNGVPVPVIMTVTVHFRLR